jgi:hypothetical protein
METGRTLQCRDFDPGVISESRQSTQACVGLGFEACIFLEGGPSLVDRIMDAYTAQVYKRERQAFQQLTVFVELSGV